MHTELLQKLGLARNEARIYETLLRIGESSVGRIAAKSGVHRRNAYDLIPMLVEKGLIYEVPTGGAPNYRAAPPTALQNIIEEKRRRFCMLIPDLGALFRAHSLEHEVFVYRGPEGWKNYMRDHLRIGKPAYYISAKGAWLDHRVRHFFPLFEKQARQRRLQYFHLFDHRVEHECPEVLEYVGQNYKFLPPSYSGPSSIDIFGDHVNLLSDISIGRMGDEIRFTVIVNGALADSFRSWFQLLWDILPKRTKNRKRYLNS